MPASRSHVVTDHPSRLINRLCKHWGHKFPVRHDEREGEILLDIGQCRLAATTTGLDLALEADNAEHLQQLQEVVADHLQRMAGDEALAFDWQR